MASMQATMFRSSVQSPGGGSGGGIPLGPRPRNQAQVQRAGHKGEVCGQDFLHHFRVAETTNGGSPFEACRYGTECRRTHVKDIDRKFTKAQALRQLQGCVHVESERSELTTKINADTSADFAA